MPHIHLSTGEIKFVTKDEYKMFHLLMCFDFLQLQVISYKLNNNKEPNLMHHDEYAFYIATTTFKAGQIALSRHRIVANSKEAFKAINVIP